MSVIEDTRKIAQDFLAPELKAIAARLDSLEKRFEESERRREKFADRVDKRFEEVERNAERRQQEVLAAIGSLTNYYELKVRLERLESRESAH